ncbi:MFS transporter [Rhodococcus sp. NPDC058514]|uniref:MFS transporter n=1 Tax=unclassified Rhodococcus (in: high G+C Gram-positive bacteria) TaxID=192944 RepID=UPI00365DB2F9
MTNAATSATRRTHPPTWILATLAFTGIVVSLMQTLVVPLIHVLPELLNTSVSTASWVITSTLLAAAVVTPVAGRLGDMFGKRRMILISMAFLVAGSVLCAISDTVPLVIIGRILQGAATGAIPLGISILRDELPAEKVGGAISVMSSTMGVGGAIGMPLAAATAQNFNWHILFWSSAALGTLVAVAVAILVPESPVRNPGRFDYLGAVGLAAGLVSLLLAITKGGEWGWTSATTLGLLGAAVVVFLAWGAAELRIAEPLVNLRVSASRPVLLTNMASIMTGFAMYATSLTVPQLLQSPPETGYGLGQSMVMAGLCMAPAGVVMMLLSPVSARITNRYGPRTTLMVGTVVIAAGYLIGAVLMSEVWQIALVSTIIGAGIGISYAAMPALIMGSVPLHETAAANGLNSLMRMVGTSFAAAVMTVVLASMTMPFGPTELPTHKAFVVTFLIGAAAALLALLIAFFIPRRTPATVAAPVPVVAPESEPAR